MQIEGNDSRECWICHDEVSTASNPLLDEVCLCRGTLGCVHQACINYWVFTQRKMTCPSCKATYYLETVYSGTAPPRPAKRLAKLWLVLTVLVFPALLSAARSIAGGTIRYGLMPFVYGTWYYRLREELYGGGTVPLADVAWWEKYLIGAVAAHSLRTGMRAWDSWLAFFNLRQSSSGSDEVFSDVEAILGMCKSMEVRVGVHGPWLQFGGQIFREALFVMGCFAVVQLCGWYLLVAAFAAALAARALIPRKQLVDKRNRFYEAQAAKSTCTSFDVAFWYIVYLCDFFFFSVALPMCGGFVLHYATAPFLVDPPGIFYPSFASLVGHWMLGGFLLIALLRFESFVVVPLFAPGIDLFVMRSIDFQDDELIENWGFVFSQVYDVDPLQVVIDFVRVGLVEVSALAVLLHYPMRFFFTWSLYAYQPTIPSFPIPFLPRCDDGSVDMARFTYAAICAGTVVASFSMYRLQRLALQFLRPPVNLMASVVGLRSYLIDEERYEMVGDWLDRVDDVELVLPRVPVERLFVRRERLMEPAEVPVLLRPRVFIFSVAFFTLATAHVFVPLIFFMQFSFYVSISSMEMICFGAMIPLFLISPKALVKSFGYFLLFFIICIASVALAISDVCAVVWSVSDLSKLAQASYDFKYMVRRCVTARPKTE